ncbi:uncharacterized protein LOC108676655 [Hyalella azteca]|uniref:Uncharacterized protein LOC108676655 n=1 Tax=Hyalella azteca TaxID=294128 RepID=A0A8B7P2C2_HYAAZ|nr:uncharacterized protein LOC108676655 [Hyalella azteca]
MEAVGGDLRNVLYTPRSKVDFGSLLCWASNIVGEQRTPCVFHVVHSSPPDPVQNCTLSDVGRTSATVRCQTGWDGGLPQTFTLSVSQDALSVPASSANNSNGTSPRVLANTSSSPKAEFTVTGLNPGQAYVLTIAAVNARGHSAPLRVALETLEDKAQERTSPGVAQKDKNRLPIGPIIAVMIGALASLTLSCVVIVLVIRARRSSARPKKCTKAHDDRDVGDAQSNQMEASFTTFLDTGGSSPDLIPYCSEAITVKAMPAGGNLTFNQLSLMDSTGRGADGRDVPGRAGRNALAGAGPEMTSAVLHRTASLPRSSLNKTHRERFYQLPLDHDFSPLVCNTKTHASLHSLHRLDGTITYMSPLKLPKVIPTSETGSSFPSVSMHAGGCMSRASAHQMSRGGESGNGTVEKTTRDSNFAPRNSRQPMRHLHQHIMRPPMHRNANKDSYDMRASNLGSPTPDETSCISYSPSPSSTTSSECTVRPESVRIDRTLPRRMDSNFLSIRVGSPNNEGSQVHQILRLHPNSGYASDVVQIPSNQQVEQSAFPGSPLSCHPSIAPQKETFDCADGACSQNETFCSPPPMFSNSCNTLESSQPLTEASKRGKAVEGSSILTRYDKKEQSSDHLVST